jgi:glyoxylase-like metal-dependent hydrolase (beta-lactamase superfamily II)
MRSRVIDLRAGFVHSQVVITDVVTIVDPAQPHVLLDALAGERIQPTDVRRIVLTHGDGDHWSGAAELAERTGAEIAAHEDDRAYIEGRGMPHFSLVKRAVIAATTRGARRPEVDRLLHGGEVIDGIEVIHTPGHTPGHICLRVEDVLIAGDAVRTGKQFREVPVFMTSDRERSRASIRRLAGLEFVRAFSGHGEPAVEASEKLRALVAALSQA